MWVAVETSDLVGSTKMSEALRLEALKGVKACLAHLLAEQLGQYEVFRGDAYQVLYLQPALALKHALLTKLYLYSSLPERVEVTQSLAIGDTSKTLLTLGENMEPVFIASGRQLETLPSGFLAYAVNSVSEDFQLALACMNRLLQLLTRKQAEMLYWSILLEFPEQKIIAQRLKVSRQNVNTHLIRAHADLFKAILIQYKHNISELTK